MLPAPGLFSGLKKIAAVGGLCLLAACGSSQDGRVPSGEGGHYKVGRPYQINGKWYEPAYDPSYAAKGEASWYGHPFHGRKTANGERFDKDLLSAAHPTLPLPSVVRVTNLRNGRSLELRVNDRGPFAKNRIIDLSEAAAAALGFKHEGTAPVEVEFIRLANSSGKPPKPSNVAVRQAPPALQTVGVRQAPPVQPARQTVAARTVARADCGTYYVQAGAFVDRGRAAEMRSDLDRFLPPGVRAHAIEDPGLTKVRAGPIGDRRAAEAVRDRVVNAGYSEAFLMKVQGPATACGSRAT